MTVEYRVVSRIIGDPVENSVPYTSFDYMSTTSGQANNLTLDAANLIVSQKSALDEWWATQNNTVITSVVLVQSRSVPDWVDVVTPAPVTPTTP